MPERTWRRSLLKALRSLALSHLEVLEGFSGISRWLNIFQNLCLGGAAAAAAPAAGGAAPAAAAAAAPPPKVRFDIDFCVVGIMQK